MSLIEFKNLPDTSTPLTAENLNFNFNEILNLICPIGKVETFFDNNDHSNYLGFTWERTLIGRVPVGIDTNDTDFDTIGETGGSKELQAHKHSYARQPISYSELVQGATVLGESSYNATYKDPDAETATAGTGNSGNLQPYQVVAFWKRTA